MEASRSLTTPYVGDRPPTDVVALVAALPCASLLLAADAPRFTILSASASYVAATRQSREALIGAGLFDVFPEHPGEGGVDALRASLERALATGVPHEIALQRYDVRRPDGTVEERHWRELNAPVVEPDGAIRYLVHTVEDRTDSVLRAAALEQANRRLAGILGQLDVLDQIGDGVTVFDREWRITYMNAAGARMAGTTADAVLGKLVWEVWPDLVGTAVEANFRRAVATGERVHFMGRIAIAGEGGGRRDQWSEVDAYALTDGLAVFLRDVTEREEARAERDAVLERERVARGRAERLQRLAAVLSRALSREEVADTIVAEMMDALGAGGGGVVELTADGREFVLLTAGGNSADVARPNHRFPVDLPVPAREVARTKAPVFIASGAERRAVLGSAVRGVGGTGDGAWAALPLVVDDRLLGVLEVTFAEPRTFPESDREFMRAFAQQCAMALARARAYAAEAAARKVAEEANRAKSEFLAIMSHELRTPLNAIDGYAELMELGIHGPLTEAQRDAIGRVRRSQKHLLGLINQVLNYARLETNAVRYDLASVPVTDVLHLVEGLIAPQMRANDLRYTVELSDPSACMFADREKVQQIVVNLLSNAVKFTPRGGSVTVTCALASDGVRIAVRDTGIGIPRDQLESIFEPFVQVDARLNRSHEGVGLGLAISRDLARGMRGNLTVASEVGVGSVFTLTLPAAARGAGGR